MFSTECEDRIQGMFEDRMNSLGAFGGRIRSDILGREQKVRLLLEYMYGIMPGSDIGNYAVDDFVDFAKHGVFLWENSSYVHKDMEEKFLQYTVLHRVNDEEIRPCREFFYKELQDRIRGMDEKSAALEINYWCAENATYQSSDDRTLSALAVYESGNGRCGEESTFLTNALRSCGLMARQVYATKWSHCDDNHAWVEVYIDGKWQFMGGCEPEEILNKGWFLSASSRAMIIQSKYFGNTRDVIDTDGCVKMCNQLNRYAHTIRFVIRVIEEKKKPVPDATIIGQIVNFAEITPVFKLVTDEEGKAELSVGRGDLILTVCKEGRMLERLIKLSGVLEDNYILEIDLSKEESMPEEFDMIAPADAPLYTGAVTPSQKLAGRKKLAEANAIRQKKQAEFKNQEVERFLGVKENAQERHKLIELLSDKDRRDLRANVLEEHLSYALTFMSGEEKDSYILNPRISNEILSCYREAIASCFHEDRQKEFMAYPKKIWNWIDQNILRDEIHEYSALITKPAGVMAMGRANELSRRILFVAIARTFGIPARLRVSDDIPEYWMGGAFVPICPDCLKVGELKLLSSEEDTSWNYRENFSIARLDKNRYQTIHLQEAVADYNKQSMNLSCELQAGSYYLLTSNRLPNGNILAKKKNFEIIKGKRTDVKLKLRQADLASMLEQIKLQPFSLSKEDGSSIDAGEVMAGKKKAFFFLEKGREPTEHILNELMERRLEFYQISKQLIFVLPNKTALKDRNISRVLKELPNIQIYYDDFSELINDLSRALYLEPEKLPLIMVTDGCYNSIYGTCGYNVGTADMLYRILMY